MVGLECPQAQAEPPTGSVKSTGVVAGIQGVAAAGNVHRLSLPARTAGPQEVILHYSRRALYCERLAPGQRGGRHFMLIHMLKSKIHRAQVTAGDVNYEGSLGISRDLMDKVGLLPYERILCGNMANGDRFETYAIPAEPGTGQIILNGATARLGKPGDRLTIMSFTEIEHGEAKFWHPRVIVLGENNAVVNERGI